MAVESREITGRLSSVNENLKAIKVLHQALIAVTAAIVAFAFRPDLTPSYKAALEELATFKQVPQAAWSNYVNHRYKERLDQNSRLIRAVVADAGLTVKGTPYVDCPVFGDQVPYEGSKLLDWDTFFSRTHQIGFMELRPSDGQSLLRQINTWGAARNPKPTIIALSLSFDSGVRYPGGSLMLDWLNRPTVGTSSALLYLTTDQREYQPASVTVTYSINSETGKFPLDWLRSDTFGQKLVDSKTDVVLPHVKVFWDKINQDTPDQATVFLQGQLEANTRGTLSFFGIPVERSLAVSAGPLITFCILVFLILHLRHLRSLTADAEVIRSFPWVVFFSGWLAAITTYTSVFLLPVSANVALIWRYRQPGEWSSRIGEFLTLCVVIAGVWVLFEVRKVRAHSAPSIQMPPRSSE